MGITGSYAGQLFGLLIGFGLAMLKSSLKTGKPVPVKILPMNNKTILDVWVVGTTIFTLAATFIYGVRSGFSFGYQGKKGMAIMLMTIYFVYIGGATYMAVKNAY